MTSAGRWQAAALALAALTVVTGAVALASVGRVEATVDEARESADRIDATLAVTEQLLTDLAETIDVLDGTFDELDAAAESGTASIDEAAQLASSIPDNLREVQNGLDDTRAAAATVDSVTGSLSELPLVGDNVRATELAPTIVAIRAGLDPVITNLEDSSLALDQLVEDTDALRQELPAVQEQLRVLTKDLNDGSQAVAGLRADPALTGETSALPWLLLRLLIVAGTVILAGTNLVVARLFGLTSTSETR